MRLSELKPGDEFILCRTGLQYKVRLRAKGESKVFVPCSRVAPGQSVVRLDINAQSMVQLLPDKELNDA